MTSRFAVQCFLLWLHLARGCSAFHFPSPSHIRQARVTCDPSPLWASSSSSSRQEQKEDWYSSLHYSEEDYTDLVEMSNIHWLQQKYNLSDEWVDKTARADRGIKTLNQHTMISQLYYLKECLKLKDEQLGRVVQKYPRFLTCRPDTNLEPTMIFLQDQFGFNTAEMSQLIQRQPPILGKSIEDGQGLPQLIDWMCNRLCLSKGQKIGKLLLTFPALLTCSIDMNLEPTFIMLQECLDLNEKETAKIFTGAPSLLGMDFKTNVAPKVEMLCDSMDLNQTQLSKLIIRAPSLLACNFTTNINPKLKLFQEKLNLNKTQLGQFLKLAPTVLNLNFTTGIQPKIDWLQENLDLNRNELRDMIKKQPQLLSLSISTFEHRLAWLHKRLPDLEFEAIRKMIKNTPAILYRSTSQKVDPLCLWLEENLALEGDHDVAAVIKKQPSLIGCSIEKNLSPTLDFYIMCIGQEEALALLKEQPIYFTYSLDRLKRRSKQAQQHGISIDVGWAKRMASYKENQWNSTLRKCSILQ